METWMVYALLSLVINGTYNFTLKVASVKNYNVSVVNKYTYFIGAILGFIYFIFNYKNYNVGNINYIFLLAFVGSFLFSLSIFSRIKSMKNIDSVIFFPIYKTIGPIIVTIVSVLFFKEILNTKEIIGIIIGISVPLMLITKKEHSIQKNLPLGLFLILITAILTSINSAFSKFVMSQEYNFALYILLIGIFGTVFSYITFTFNKKNNHKHDNKGITKFSIMTGILNFASLFVFVKALEGNLAIVFTINSFSILIPIILSVFFYKEHFNLRKFIVIMLSIISILLFI